MTKVNKIQIRKVADLRDHPAQESLFCGVPDHEIVELAADISRNGLKHPIETLPDDTVVAGHQRLRALRLLGWDEVEVIVRYDLADDPEAAERALINDNLIRRQLGKLAKARLYARLIELEPRCPLDSRDKRPRVDLAEQLARRLNCSRRNVDRYLAITRTPLAVQQAFDREELAVTLAARVAALPEDQQAAIAAAIEAGMDPKQAVFNQLEAASGSATNPQTSCRRFLKQVQKAVDELTGRVPSLTWMTLVGGVRVLEQGRALIDELLEHERSLNHGHADKQAEERMDDLLQRISRPGAGR